MAGRGSRVGEDRLFGPKGLIAPWVEGYVGVLAVARELTSPRSGCSRRAVQDETSRDLEDGRFKTREAILDRFISQGLTAPPMRSEGQGPDENSPGLKADKIPVWGSGNRMGGILEANPMLLFLFDPDSG